MKLKWFFAALFALGTFSVLAQDNNEVSDEDLKRYAIAMDSVNDMKKELLQELSTMVKENETVTNARYNELSKVIDDEEQLKQANATPDEINFVKEVQAKKQNGAEEITEVFQTLARDYIGVEKYNQIKNAIETDQNVKRRYDAILKEIEQGG